jgi:hypothetical protein
MNENDKTLEKIDKQLEDIENKMHMMIDGVELDTLTPTKRWDFHMKLMSQYHRLLVLRKQAYLALPDDHEHTTMMKQLMRHLRGETDDEEDG